VESWLASTDHRAAGDCFVTPMLEYNWSLVVSEAMACGSPILCSTYSGCWPELVEPDRNGWVFDPLDLAHFTQALSYAIEQGEELGTMGEASRAIISQDTPQHAAVAVLQACRIANATISSGEIPPKLGMLFRPTGTSCRLQGLADSAARAIA
jgi:hypothetical protein